MTRAKRKPPTLRLFCQNREPVFDAPLYLLRIDSELINRLSDEFFGDPTPCAIHQNAVVTRIFAELEVALGRQGEVAVSSLTPRMREYFSLYPECAYCRLEEDV